MSRKLFQCGIGENKNDRLIVPDEKLGEVIHTMQAMMSNGLPPHVIIDRIIERYRHPDSPIQENFIHDAQEALRACMESYQYTVRKTLFSKDFDEPPTTSDPLTLLISSASANKGSRPQSRGTLRDEVVYGEEKTADSVRIVLKGSSRPQSRGNNEQKCKGETFLECSLQQTRSDLDDGDPAKAPFYLVRPVSTEELKAAVLQQPASPQTALHTHSFHQMQQAPQPVLHIDMEPSRELHPTKEQPMDLPSRGIQEKLQKEENCEVFLTDSLTPEIPPTVKEFVSTNEIENSNECVAERLIEYTNADEKPEVLNPPLKTVKEGVSNGVDGTKPPHQVKAETSKVEPSSRSRLNPSPTRVKPPVESCLAGGEGSMCTHSQIVNQDAYVSEAGQSVSSRSGHRSAPSTSRSSVSRKRTSLPKKKENYSTRNIVLAASIIGFIAAGGYILYKNRNSPLQF